MSPEHITPAAPGPRVGDLPAAPPSAPPAVEGNGHATHVAHHFRDMRQQHEAGTLGMWMFLATEVLFFGAVLTAYDVYRFKYPDEFTRASHLLYMWIGAANTVILLCSSLTMALAVRAAKVGQGRRMVQLFMGLTLVLGLAFLVVKGYEYLLDHREHLIPNLNFPPEDWPAGLDARHGSIFFTFYFVLTGIHALHMLVGLALLAVLLFLAGRDRYGPRHYMPVEVMGLYWHFVDIVWVFLFPLLYLIR